MKTEIAQREKKTIYRKTKLTFYISNTKNSYCHDLGLQLWIWLWRGCSNWTDKILKLWPFHWLKNLTCFSELLLWCSYWKWNYLGKISLLQTVLIYIPFLVHQLSSWPWVNCYSHLTIVWERVWNLKQDIISSLYHSSVFLSSTPPIT